MAVSEPGVAATSPPSNTPVGDTTVLIVDDSLVFQRLVARIVEKGGLRTAFARNGCLALELIEREAPALVLTDLHMPEMDGLELVKQVRSQYPLLPVILMTANGSEETALEALRRGASSYVPKRNLEAELVQTLRDVLVSARVGRQVPRVMAGLVKRDSQFRLANDPALVPALVSMLQEEISAMRLCDDTACIRVGVALGEALLEGMYRGNLEIDPEQRHQNEEAFNQLVQKRSQEYRHRRLHLYACLDAAAATYVIRHEGRAFGSLSSPNPTDPANLEKAGARGLLLIHTFMDRVTVDGNQIRMIKNRDLTPRSGLTQVASIREQLEKTGSSPSS